MPEFELSSLGANGPREELMTQTNPKVRNLLLQDASDEIETGVEVRGIPGPGRYHHSVRLKTLDLFMRGAKGNDGHATSPLDERSHNVSLYTAIEDYDVRPGAFNSLWFWGRDLSDDVALPWEGCLSGASDKILVASSSGVLDDHSSGVADISDVQSQRTRINPCDPRNAVAFEEFVDRPGRSSVTGRLGKLSYDEARDPGPSRFVRVVVDPIIAN